MRISLLRHFANIASRVLPPTRYFELHYIIWTLAGLDAAKTAKICGNTKVLGRGILRVGTDTWISPGSIFMTNQSSKIILGNNCDIGPEVAFVTGSHEIGSSLRRAGKGVSSSIVIEDGVWIGARSTILGGVTVGKGAIIAAGSLVKENVPKNALAAGVPAQIKKTYSC